MPLEPAQVEEIRSMLLAFSGWDRIPDDILRRLAESATYVGVKRKRSLFRRGEPGPGLFLVRSGEFKLSLISAEGREQILYLAGDGRLIGEGFLPKEVPCACSAFAMVDSEVYRFDADAVIRQLAQSEQLAFAIMRQMAFRANRLIDLVLDLSLRSVQRRLASFLYSLAVRSGAEPGKPHAIPRHLDMNTVAARLGTVREEISRALNRMQRDGVLRLSRQEIIISDLSALEVVTYE
jgi:CRP/FNR family transcriptional regulator